MRPELRFPHDDPSAVLRCLEALLCDKTGMCIGTVSREHAVLHVRSEDEHFWSSHLEVEAQLPDPEDELAPERPQIHGRFAPHPNVWMMFVCIYGLLGTIGIAGLVYGMSPTWLHQTPWALAATPAAVALIGFPYGATFIGQGLGAAQMYELRTLLDRAVADPGKTEGAPAVRSES